MTEKAGKYFAAGILQPEILHAAGIVAVHAGQHSVDQATGERHTGVEVGAVTDALLESARKALAPDAGTALLERTLLASAALLANLMVSWTVRATQADTAEQLELYARLALKAQDQQRRTLATLADIRHPRPTTFIRQQNQAVNQQVVNKTSLAASLVLQAATQLLEDVPDERLDARTESAASRGHPPLATVGALHRPAHLGRESQEPLQRLEARRPVSDHETGL